MFQSTRPRGRTRHRRATLHRQKTVSIHASSREDATRSKSDYKHDASFNPRVLAGGRDLQCGLGFIKSLVSIHASSREDATSLYSVIASIIRFNPRVLAGGRDCECRKQYKSKCYICKSAKEIILIINEEQYHFS